MYICFKNLFLLIIYDQFFITPAGFAAAPVDIQLCIVVDICSETFSTVSEDVKLKTGGDSGGETTGKRSLSEYKIINPCATNHDAFKSIMKASGLSSPSNTIPPCREFLYAKKEGEAGDMGTNNEE